MTNKKPTKIETVDEFLARGGKINVIPPQEPEEPEVNVRKTTTGPANIMTLQEGQLMFGEKITRKRKAKKVDSEEVNKHWDSLNELNKSGELSEQIKKDLGL